MSANPYTGPLGGVIRARPDDLRRISGAAGVIVVLSGLSTLPLTLAWHQDDGVHPLGLASSAVVAAVGAVTFGGIVPRLSEKALVYHGPWLTTLGNGGSIVLVSFLTYWGGPTLSFLALFFTPMSVFAFSFFRLPYARLASVGMMAGFGLSLFAQDDPPFPLAQWSVVGAVIIGTSLLVGGITTSVEDTRNELADLNEHLEMRVAEQVDELARTSRLRRFLSPQVADVVTSEGAGEMLAPHRADIAAFFVDLRGFTAFTNAVSAERVMRVLDEYYSAVGSLLDEHGATIGGFDGDGIFAYIGDPVPHADAPRDAIAMAREVAGCLDQLVTKWSGDEASLGYGIGLAYGEATLGLVGFASRADYTPVGAVVNLAARLCGDARHGEILIDDALRKTADLRDGVARRSDVELKGFGVTATYVVDH